MAPTRALVAAALLAAAVGLSATLSGAAPAPRSRPGPSLASCRQTVPTETLVSGKLTVATNNPAIAPWFVNDSPSNKEGYESALAYQLASLVGFKASAVSWYAEPFELATTAGSKPFDFDINEITYAKSLTSSVGLSASYYNVNQSFVALKTNGIVKRHSPKQLATYRYGAVAGSPGLTLVDAKIKPTHKPVAYKTLAAAVTGLMDKKIDAIVIDTPTGQYLTSKQLPKAVQFAQLHTTGQYYVLVLQKGSPLLACVDSAIKRLRADGALTALSKKYLKVYNSIPFINP